MADTGRAKPGWKRVKFGDVVRLSKARSQEPLKDGFERYVGLEHLEPGDLRIRSWGNVADGVTFTSVFRPGQVLFGKRRAYQRKVAVADFAGVCSGDIYVLETADAQVLLPELLPFICQTETFFDHAVGSSAGSLSPRTNWASLASYEFLLPPLEEQRRHLDALSAMLHTAAQLVDLARIAELARMSQLLHSFRRKRGSCDHFPKEWAIRTVRDCGNVQVGIRKHPGSLSGSNMRPYLRVANVLDDEITWDEVMSIHVPDPDIIRCALKEGDILVNKGNSINLVGRASIFRKSAHMEGEVFFQDHLMRFRPNEDVDSEYALGYFQHLLYTSQFTRIAGASTSIATIPLAAFEGLPFPVPPIGEQVEIGRTLRGLADACNCARKRLAATRSMMRSLMEEWA
ncbi:MAG: restriction endonuclease subunit S [Burkholderiales bacterium]|nr:restriction endonuclease subunit S [Burkholderiales bacterium]